MKKKEKYYFDIEGEGWCYPLDYFQDFIDDGAEEFVLRLAKRAFGNGTMWCKEFGEAFESGDGECGRLCKYYKPRNGKSGCCKLLVNCFEPVGKELVLTKEGLK